MKTKYKTADEPKAPREHTVCDGLHSYCYLSFVQQTHNHMRCNMVRASNQRKRTQEWILVLLSIRTESVVRVTTLFSSHSMKWTIKKKKKIEINITRTTNTIASKCSRQWENKNKKIIQFLKLILLFVYHKFQRECKRNSLCKLCYGIVFISFKRIG